MLPRTANSAAAAFVEPASRATYFAPRNLNGVNAKTKKSDNSTYACNLEFTPDLKNRDWLPLDHLTKRNSLSDFGTPHTRWKSLVGVWCLANESKLCVLTVCKCRYSAFSISFSTTS